MGTWGAGNLDNDSALDLVGEKSSVLIQKVWSLLQSKSSMEGDEFDYCALFVEIETIFALEGQGLFNGWDLPKTADFDAAVATWLPLWADYFDGLSGPDFKAERRAVIEETFAKLRAIVEKYEARRG